ADNRLAHGGARAVAGEPGRRFNPLFLYGPSGTGKTHLLMAIGAEVERSGIRCAYVSGEDFTTEFIASLRDRKGEAFRRKWRTVDVLLIDDVQFLADKEATKEEFFHTFNALVQSGRQVVLAADRAPRDLPAFDQRLRSRFESGLVADVAPPDFETRLAILQARCAAERIRMQDDVLAVIATLVPGNVRTLEGALTNLVASTSLFGETPTVDRTREILERYLGPGIGLPSAEGRRIVRSRITADLIQQVVADRFELNVDLLSSKRRDREIAQARHIAMHLSRELTGASLLSIGQAFGGRDHSTVAHACDRIRTQAGADNRVQLLLDDIVDELRARSEAR
ncbi:MAG: chromosomal replication initiator protein DnaA, partial [Armatimonadota bacterium]